MTALAAILIAAAPEMATAGLGHPDHDRREAAEGWCRAHLIQPHPATLKAAADPSPEVRRRAARLLGGWDGVADMGRRCRPRLQTLAAAVVLYWPAQRYTLTEAAAFRDFGWAGMDRRLPPAVATGPRHAARRARRGGRPGGRHRVREHR